MSDEAVPNHTREEVHEATTSDVSNIVSLINHAFAVERFFKNADRTDPETVHQNMNEGKFLLLHQNNKLVACVFVKITDDRAYLGTLSVDPAQQKSGLGRRMMAEAEA